MIGRTEIKLDLSDLDSLVKLDCARIECTNNLVMSGGPFQCNNKYVSIDENGQCSSFGERRSTKKYEGEEKVESCDGCDVEFDTDIYPCDQCTINPNAISHFKSKVDKNAGTK